MCNNGVQVVNIQHAQPQCLPVCSIYSCSWWKEEKQIPLWPRWLDSLNQLF